jgi:spore coat protein CotF
MANPNQCTQIINEKDILQDSLMSQKQISSAYNTYAGECVNQQLRGAMLGILDDEHKIQADIFCTMQSNGWYKVDPAEQQKLAQVRQKFSTSM